MAVATVCVTITRLKIQLKWTHNKNVQCEIYEMTTSYCLEAQKFNPLCMIDVKTLCT